MTIKPRRSALYMPATNARAIDKARTLPVDAVTLDLEDSIAPEKKDEARAAAVAAIRTGGFGRREVVIRTNGLGTQWFKADFEAAANAAPDAILVPKIEQAEDLRRIGERFAALKAAPRTRLWIMMETPLAVLNAASIAAASKHFPDCRLATFVLGNNDIQRVTRSLDHPERLPLMFALQSLVMAARAYGLSMLDGVYNNFKDLDGFRRECEQGRMLGMDGKTLIHPSQVEIANAAYGPPVAEIARARRIIAAFDAPEAKGKGAISLDGEMVELLHLEIARRTVEIADAIAAVGT
jgi:citrate lyase subunit beta / citryl-CoA lyase